MNKTQECVFELFGKVSPKQFDALLLHMQTKRLITKRERIVLVMRFEGLSFRVIEKRRKRWKECFKIATIEEVENRGLCILVGYWDLANEGLYFKGDELPHFPNDGDEDERHEIDLFL